MLLIGNGKVITRNSANPYLENGAVVTVGEKYQRGWNPGCHEAEISGG